MEKRYRNYENRLNKGKKHVHVENVYDRLLKDTKEHMRAHSVEISTPSNSVRHN
jgi:hypothetical protein